MMHYWWNSGFGMGGFWMILVWTAIIVITAVIIYLLISHMKKQVPPENNKSGYNKSAAIIKERYAKGEITREEYKQMLEDIKD